MCGVIAVALRVFYSENLEFLYSFPKESWICKGNNPCLLSSLDYCRLKLTPPIVLSETEGWLSIVG